jgi:phosphotransferase system enzyme I (PtsP)
MRVFRHIVDMAKRFNVPLTMCGELAGKPMEALALMAVGMNRLSMGPPSIGPIKEMILGLDLEPIRRSVAASLLEGADGASVRELLTEWAERQNLPIA